MMPSASPADREERRRYTAGALRRAMGRTCRDITCPFCATVVTAYVWSLAGGGKRCSCGAKHLAGGWTVRRAAK